MKITCSLPNCQTELEINEKISDNFRYVCRYHTRKEQVEFVGRKYNSVTDHADEQVVFQSHQFDKDLTPSKLTPLGPFKDDIDLESDIIGDLNG